MREMTRAIRKTLLALTALATLASSANAGHRVTGRVALDVDVYVEEVVPADERLKAPKITKTSDPKKTAARNQGYQSRVVSGYCGYAGTHTFGLKVDRAVMDELNSQYFLDKQTKKWGKLAHLAHYWIEGSELADYECELADRQSVSTARGLLSLYRRAADLPQPKPWLDASEVIKCEEMPNYFGCKLF